MRQFLLDTGVAHDFIHRRNCAFQRADFELARGNRIGIGVPVLGELYAGAEGSATRERNLLRVRREIKKLLVWPFNESAAEEFGRIAAELRRRGRPIQQVDIQIAAIALSLGGCTVVTTDGDFRWIPGLSVESPIGG